MLHIVGGTYLEICREPVSHEMFGSGLRAATALSTNGFEINFHSCIDKSNLETARSICETFGIKHDFIISPYSIAFNYDYPLARPNIIGSYASDNLIELNNIATTNILYYGLLEAICEVHGDYVVYDPQSWKSFQSTGSTAKHLAVVLNQFEAKHFSGLFTDDLYEIGKYLLQKEKADVIVIKNGAKGALVFQENAIDEIPVFRTNSVWPIGSGDIFSAVFARKWMIEKLPAEEAAYLASMSTAFYCETRDFPLPEVLPYYEPVIGKYRKVYLAGPFFSIAERWLIHQLRNLLQNMGHTVFSPFHDVGIGQALATVEEDIKGIDNAEIVFAVVSGKDPGTIFEIGYAIALGKKIIVLAENVSEEDLMMLKGTGCEITDDLSTAVYKVAW